MVKELKLIEPTLWSRTLYAFILRNRLFDALYRGASNLLLFLKLRIICIYAACSKNIPTKLEEQIKIEMPKQTIFCIIFSIYYD